MDCAAIVAKHHILDRADLVHGQEAWAMDHKKILTLTWNKEREFEK
jgi:hypothetical protein